MNWTWLLVRIALGLSILGLLFFSQRFWYRAIWRVTSNWGNRGLRVAVRLIYVTALLLSIVAEQMNEEPYITGCNTVRALKPN